MFFDMEHKVRIDMALMQITQELYEHILEFHDVDTERKLKLQKAVITFDALLTKLREIGGIDESKSFRSGLNSERAASQNKKNDGNKP